nr:MAG TPA: hypothetical protein [Bacteriophage sp.]
MVTKNTPTIQSPGYFFIISTLINRDSIATA